MPDFGYLSHFKWDQKIRQRKNNLCDLCLPCRSGRSYWVGLKQSPAGRDRLGEKTLNTLRYLHSKAWTFSLAEGLMD